MIGKKFFALGWGLATFATLSAASPIAGAAPASEEPIDVVLQVDTSDLGPIGPRIRERVTFEAGEHIAAAGMRPAEAARAKVLVKVRFVGEDMVDYAFTVDAVLGEDSVAGAKRSGECKRCVPDALVEAVSAELPAELATLRKAMNDADRVDRPAAVPAARTGDAPHDPVQAPADRPKQRRLGSAGIAGVVLLSIGAPALGVGIGLAVRKTKLEQDVGGDPQERDGLSTKPVGYALVGCGAAAVVMGTVMLILDRRTAKRRMSLAPTMDGRWSGVTLTGRF